MKIHGTPQNIEQLHDLFISVCKDAGLTVKDSGSSYSNGPEYNAEIIFPGSEPYPLQAFTMIRESQDDNYLIERYEGEENEPDDPDGRSRTMTLTDEGAEALRRELEEDEHFKSLGHAEYIRYDRDSMEPDIGPEG